MCQLKWTASQSRKLVFAVSDKVRHKQSQKMTTGLKFRIWEGIGIVLCSENKGTDQLHGYHAADLCLCSCIMQKAVILMTQLNVKHFSRYVYDPDQTVQ